MSGHSKWATTKRQKAAVDAKRGAAFTKLAKVITVAAREKGGDPAANFMLRMAIEKAKQANMPKENIERAIKRGTGELAGEAIEELLYEGFGPAKTQFIVRVLTDNKNRSAANIRHLFAKHGGALGAVGWNFHELGVIQIKRTEVENKGLKKEGAQLALIDAGAQDIENEEEGMTVYSAPGDLQKLKQFLEDQSLNAETAGIEYAAKEKITVSEEDRDTLEKFMEELEENEDVADYYTNANI